MMNDTRKGPEFLSSDDGGIKQRRHTCVRCSFFLVIPHMGRREKEGREAKYILVVGFSNYSDSDWERGRVRLASPSLQSDCAVHSKCHTAHAATTNAASSSSPSGHS